MAKKQQWQDEYWLLLMEQYLKKPVGIKPLYCRGMVALSLELHITPEELHKRMGDIALLRTPRIERFWRQYSKDPERLKRAIQLMRSMSGFNSAGRFYEGVEVMETFERDFRPLSEEKKLTPIMLIITLDLYFRLTPNTMVCETPEIRQLARLMQVPVKLIVEVMDVYQHCDPYLRRRDVVISRLLLPCQQVWQRYGNGDVQQLADYAEQLKAYFRS